MLYSLEELNSVGSNLLIVAVVVLGSGVIISILYFNIKVDHVIEQDYFRVLTLTTLGSLL